MAPEEITSEWLSTVLGADVTITGDRRIGDGLVGMNVRYELAVPAGSDLPTSIIAKLPSPDPTSRATGVSLRNYEREVKFYAQIAPTVDIRVARCFHGEWHEADGDFVLLLEDLSPAEQGNQITGCTAEMAERSVLELARLHGPRWADPSLAEIEFLQRRGADDAAGLQMLWTMFLPGFLATFAKYLDTEGVALIERFGALIPSWIEGRTLPDTVTHGDYRLDNLMFASERGGYPLATVDWQTPGHGGSPADRASIGRAVLRGTGRVRREPRRRRVLAPVLPRRIRRHRHVGGGVADRRQQRSQRGDVRRHGHSPYAACVGCGCRRVALRWSFPTSTSRTRRRSSG